MGIWLVLHQERVGESCHFLVYTKKVAPKEELMDKNDAWEIVRVARLLPDTYTGNRYGQLEQNKQMATAFYDLMFNQN